MSVLEQTKNRGFTIVELLIVIVVIAILAAISIVAYSGLQARARDSQRQSDIANIAKAMQMYKIDNGDYPNQSSGCASGSSGAGSGWFNVNYNSPPGSAKSVNQCLVADKKLPSDIIDPSGSTSCSGLTCRAYMLYNCGATAWLFANLETKPQSSTATDGTCAPNWDTTYGMNYVVQLH